MVRCKICSALCLGVLSLAVLPYGYANGGDFMCSGKIISLGGKEYEVLAKCGEPESRHTRTEKRLETPVIGGSLSPSETERYLGQPAVEVTVEIEEWVYNFGPSNFMRFLTFENGTLKSIRTGDYGQ